MSGTARTARACSCMARRASARPRSCRPSCARSTRRSRRTLVAGCEAPVHAATARAAGRPGRPLSAVGVGGAARRQHLERVVPGAARPPARCNSTHRAGHRGHALGRRRDARLRALPRAPAARCRHAAAAHLPQRRTGGRPSAATRARRAAGVDDDAAARRAAVGRRGGDAGGAQRALGARRVRGHRRQPVLRHRGAGGRRRAGRSSRR